LQENFEDTKGVKLESVNQRADTTMTKRKRTKGQKNKQRSTKHYTENERSSNKNYIKNRG